MQMWTKFIRLSLFFYVCRIWSLPTVNPERVPCFRDLELHFFDERIVGQALSLYNIRQELWVPINQTLQLKSLEVPSRMKKKTAFMVPNPIEYPMQGEVTARILREVLFEIFLETMKIYQVNERPTSDFVFDYIFQEQISNFINCFGKEVIKLQPNLE